MWRDLLLFGEHTWGSPASGSDPDGADTVAQWEYKRRFLDGAAAAGDAPGAAPPLRVGLRICGGGGGGRGGIQPSRLGRGGRGGGAPRAAPPARPPGGG